MKPALTFCITHHCSTANPLLPFIPRRNARYQLTGKKKNTPSARGSFSAIHPVRKKHSPPSRASSRGQQRRASIARRIAARARARRRQFCYSRASERGRPDSFTETDSRRKDVPALTLGFSVTTTGPRAGQAAAAM